MVTPHYNTSQNTLCIIPKPCVGCDRR